MARIPAPSEQSVPPQHLEAFREVVRSRVGLAHTGPSVVMLHSPEAARRARHLSIYLRGSAVLTLQAMELAILVATREMDCTYIWNEHAAHARQAGVPADLVEALRVGEDLPPMSPPDQAVVQYGRELIRAHRVKPDTFQAALDHFGVQGLTEMTMLMGYYTMGAFCVNAFGEEPSPSSTEPPLLVQDR